MIIDKLLDNANNIIEGFIKLNETRFCAQPSREVVC